MNCSIYKKISCHQRDCTEKVFLKISQIHRGKPVLQSLFNIIKLQGTSLQLINKRLQQKDFPVNFA